MRKHITDILVAFCIAVFSFGVYFLTVSGNGISPRSVEVQKDGKIYATYDLETVIKEININGTIINIEKDNVYIKHSVCRDKQCQNMGKISKVGEKIICLPEKIVITIEGESNIDAVSY